jgi:hypothetical protein
MDTPVCSQVQLLLQTVPKAKSLLSLLERLGEHVRDCADCKHALALLAASLGIAAPPSNPSYETCEADLAAYVDLEYAKDSVVAGRRFPHVWWSLWLDLESAEVYEGMQYLVAASQEGLLAAMPVPKVQYSPGDTTTRKTYLYTLPRMVLSYTINPPAQYGSWRGEEQGALQVLDEEEVEESYRLSMSVEAQDSDHYALSVSLEPLPEAAKLIVTIGEREYQALFDEDQQAVIRDIPSELIVSSDGPDLIIHIEDV